MVVDGATGPFSEVGGIPDVVPVAVGEKEGVRLNFFLFQKIEKALGGVDGEEMAIEVDQVGVGRGEATRISQRFFHGLLGRGDEGLRD